MAVMRQKRPSRAQQMTLSNSKYYAHRLADMYLLDHAIRLPGGDIAVPVGGCRQGGYAQVSPLSMVPVVLEKMRLMPDQFPNAYYDEDMHVITWGIEPGDWRFWDARETGLYFGYTEEAVDEFEHRVEHHEATGEWLPWSYEKAGN